MVSDTQPPFHTHERDSMVRRRYEGKIISEQRSPEYSGPNLIQWGGGGGGMKNTESENRFSGNIITYDDDILYLYMFSSSYSVISGQ